MIRVFNLL